MFPTKIQLGINTESTTSWCTIISNLYKIHTDFNWCPYDSCHIIIVIFNIIIVIITSITIIFIVIISIIIIGLLSF